MTSPRRRWWVAGLLGLGMAGLGQIYNGEARKGLLGFGGTLLLTLLAGGLFITPVTPFLALALLGASFGLYGWLVLDAVLTARRLSPQYERRAYNRWYVYAGAFLLSLLIREASVGLLRSRVVQSFAIPSGSMEPTILPGDHLYVDKWTFRRRAPRRGDLAVFRSTQDPAALLTQRVIAVPGDRVEIVAKRLHVNGRAKDEPYAVHRDLTIYSPGPGASDQGVRRDNFGPLTLAEGQFFVMGDNRDASLDSRFYGPVPRDHFVGGPRMVVYWSRPAGGPTRWYRIGSVSR